MQDMEFTVETRQALHAANSHGKALALRSISASQWTWLARSSLKLKKHLKESAPEDMERLFYPVIDPKLARTELASRKLAEGINAVPGAAVGKGGIHRARSRGMGRARRKGDSGAAARPAPRTWAA